MTSRLVISGGTVITASETVDASVLVEGEQVVAVAQATSDLVRSFSVDAEIIDATGKYVIPGGIDAHTHLEAGDDTVMVPDTFATGTVAAAFGGTTTIIDFAAPLSGGRLVEGLERYHGKADGHCAIDYSFHMSTASVDDQSIADMDTLIAEGVTSFKLFMAYPGQWHSPDDRILRAMLRAAETGALIMMHAENGLAIDLLRDRAMAGGERDPVFHALTRPEALEAEAVHRSARLAEVAGAPVYIVHLSSAAALAEVRNARERGTRIFAETCPQYLFLDIEDLRRPDGEGAKYVCSPPLRAWENHSTLWRGIGRGDLDTVATDHCPYCWSQKEGGLDDFRKIPNGLPGIEHRVEQMYAGVVDGHLTLNRWVEVCCTAPAKTFGLYPRKGTIIAGADADLVIFDPNTPRTISASNHHMNVDYSVYEGQQLPGRVVTTLLRGRRLVDGDRFVGAESGGQYLRRSVQPSSHPDLSSPFIPHAEECS